MPQEEIFSLEELQDPDFIKRHFYTIDATTSIDEDKLQYDKLMSYDATIKKREDNLPQILIYHTHGQEGYMDSVSEDPNTRIIGVGEELTRLLEDVYGYRVLHDRGEYDKNSRDYAYQQAAIGLEKILNENPTIEVIIDLHRDAVKEGTHLVTDRFGKPMATFMFFHGLSYLNGLGKLEQIPNLHLDENMAFAFQLQLAAKQKYPDLTRKTYLKGYRYNMQYRPKSLLIELGAQTNTVEEAKNTCEPLAKVLDEVLSGRNRQ